MKKTLKALLLLSLIGPVVGCSNNGGNGGGNKKDNDIPSPSNPVKDIEEHLVEGTIHDFDINYDRGVPFVTNKNTDYYIATINDDYAIEAARFIALHLFSATNVEFEVKILESGAVVSSSEKAIVIGSEESFTNAGLTKTSKNLGITGYEMYTKGNACFIMGSGDESYELAALKFLEIVVGYDTFYQDCFIYEKDGAILPHISAVERPDFDYRKSDDPGNAWKYSAGYSNNQVFMTVGGIQYHTSFQFCQPEVYGEEHPKWFTDRTIAQGISSSTKGANVGQLCYTAHGDATELKLMKQRVADVLIETYDKNPDLYNVTFTIEDNGYVCDCDECTRVKNEYNGSIAATILLFLNDVDDIVQAHYEKVAEETGTRKREAYCCFFAYHATEDAPVKVVNGKYEPVNGIKTNEHVGVFIAAIGSVFTHSFYESINEESYLKINSWAAVTNRIYAWTYECNFQNYFYPFNSFGAMVETYRLLKANNCLLIYPQDEHNVNGRTVFTKLKHYINSKALIDVNVNTNDLIDKFFKYYYGKGGTYMRQFYDEMVQWCVYQEENWPITCNGTIYALMNNATYWNENVVKKWESLCNKAIDEIAYLKASDKATYQQQYDAIVTESISPRWILLELFSNSFTSEELNARRKSFMEDALRLNFDKRKESNGLLIDTYQSWGLL